jgi:hypothetical protein
VRPGHHRFSVFGFIVTGRPHQFEDEEGYVGERALCFIWCEACCERHWGLMNHLGEERRAVSKSGTLKIALQCEACWTELAPGEEATAITIDGGADCAPWEDGFLDVDPSA